MEKQHVKKYDLEDRTFKFAQNVYGLIRTVPKTLTNIEVCKQLTRSSGSVGANYIEANEALSKKDFRMRIKICRKEAKESAYWLSLLFAKSEQTPQKETLYNESRELMNIFGAILIKSK